MRALGVDLASIDAPPLTRPPAPDCPGARLRVSRAEYDALSAGGERFQSKRQDIPYDGLGDARVLCSATVGAIPNTTSNAVLYFGLCHSCSGLEADNRAALRERQNQRREPR